MSVVLYFCEHLLEFVDLLLGLGLEVWEMVGFGLILYESLVDFIGGLFGFFDFCFEMIALVANGIG